MRNLDRRPLAGKVAVVTGASEGIGRGIAVDLARLGADVALCGRRLHLLKEVAEEVLAHGQVGLVVPLDVSQLDAIAKARELVASEFGAIHILVNSAGFSVNAPAWDLTEHDWDLMCDVGLKGTFFSCQAFGSLMRAQGYGKIINLASTLSRGVMPGASAYATVKAGVSHLTRALAVEWASEGIRVNAVGPASTATPSRASRQTAEHRARLVRRIPLNRMGEVEDLLPMVAYLASSDSDFVTGQTLFVDGGWTAASPN
jgi:NAD(P)-dependent dehydrogenase (short-subunit alcohol dehydrogenase family)